MDIQTIRQRIQDGNYLVKIHAIQHALKEEFKRKHMPDENQWELPTFTRRKRKRR